jgi:hypothetical protein
MFRLSRGAGTLPTPQDALTGCNKWQHREMACTLDSNSELSLLAGVEARLACWLDATI